MTLSLMWWEHEQLLDHLRSREDIWSSSRENMWMRQHNSDDDTPCLGLAISPPVGSSPFRRYAYRTIALGWSQEQCDEYLTALARKWTDYSVRMIFTQFLVDEVKMDVDKAQSVAIALCGLEQSVITPDPEVFALPTQRELWPDIAGVDLSGVNYDDGVQTYGITGGGWLSIRRSADMLRVRASLRSHTKYGAGYGGVFEGFIRPRDGNIKLASVFLFGDDLPKLTEEVSVEEVQVLREERSEPVQEVAHDLPREGGEAS